MLIPLLLAILLLFIIGFLYVMIPFDVMCLYPKTILAMSKLPGPRGIFPFIGLAVVITKLDITGILPIWKKFSQDYPRLIAFWVMGIPYGALFEADDIEVLLSSVNHIKKGFEYGALTSWLQEGLLISSGEKWHKRRKMLTPAFHFRILEDSLGSLNKHARYLIKNMLEKEGKPIVAEHMIVRCTLDTICETAMGYSLNLQKNEKENSEYLEAVRKVCSLAVDRLISISMSRDDVYALTKNGKLEKKYLKLLHNFTEKIIQERKMDYSFQNNDEQKEQFIDEDVNIGRKKKAFLDILIELDRKEGNIFSDKDIREEVDTFMFEGHDTVHASLVHTLYLLGKHQDIQENAYQELYEIFGDSDRAVTSRDLHEMQYLEKIIKESLRLYPSVPYMTRCLTQDLKLSGDVVLPAGLNLAFIPYLLHRDPKYYPNPEVFDPERFSVENCKNRHPYAYIPFSAGPRNCIGQKFALMELKIVLSTILRFAKVHNVNEIDESQFIPLVILRSKEPIQIKVTAR